MYACMCAAVKTRLPHAPSYWCTPACLLLHMIFAPLLCILTMPLQVWVKPSTEMQYLYGNHVLKSGLARITENTPAYTGVVVYNMADIPLGFGVTAKSTNDCRSLDPSAIVAFHQADAGKSMHCMSEDTIVTHLTVQCLMQPRTSACGKGRREGLGPVHCHRAKEMEFIPWSDIARV